MGRAVALAGYPYFFAVLLDSPHAVAIGRISYGLALMVLVVGAGKTPLHDERSGRLLATVALTHHGVHRVRG